VRVIIFPGNDLARDPTILDGLSADLTLGLLQGCPSSRPLPLKKGRHMALTREVTALDISIRKQYTR
jgi:hypothetical protein